MIVDRKQLVELLQTGAAIVPTNPKPVLEYGLLYQSRGGDPYYGGGGPCLVLAATSLEMSVVRRLPGERADIGKLLVPLRKLTAILGVDTSEQARIEMTESGFVLRTERAEFRISTPPVNEFPAVMPDIKGETLTVEAEDLKRAVERTARICNVSSRYATQCVQIAPGAGQLIFSATDGCRICRQPIVAVGKLQLQASILVDADMLAKAAGILDGEVQLKANENWLRCSGGGTIVYIRQVEGRYPKTDEFIAQYSHEVVSIATADAGELARLVRQASFVDKDADLAVSDGKLTLSIGDQSHQEMPAASDSEQIARLRLRFLKDAMRGLEGEVEIGFYAVKNEDRQTSRVVSIKQGDYSHFIQSILRPKNA